MRNRFSGSVVMDFRVIAALLCVAFFSTLMSSAAHAATPGAGATAYATVWKVRGDVFATAGQGGKERKLKEGDTVFVGDRVRAPATAEVVLKTADAGVVAVRPNTEFVAERYAAEGKPTDNSTVRLFTGSLRIISGWIGSVNRSEQKVVTPQSTIGIRGTDHEPYVLPADIATGTENRPGTYDKVNRGGTTIEAGGKKLDVEPGKVGFVRSQEKAVNTRALMTLLLPVLLEKVPAFYVPGEFDGDLDRYSDIAAAESARLLEQKQKTQPAARVAPCQADKIGRDWLGQLDQSIARSDAGTIIGMFDPSVTIRVTVREQDGKQVTIELGRDEMAQSTIAAVSSLQDYQQKRHNIEAKPLDGNACQRINVKSAVSEQGRQGGKPYRFESQEDFILELRNGKWLATKAESVQR
jgi:hypothetical protein